MPTTEVATTLLPATDALSLVCAAIADLKGCGAVLSSQCREITVLWTGERATVVHLEMPSGRSADIDLPDRWDVSTRVEVFCAGVVE